VLVSTPAAFLSLQQRGKKDFSWPTFGLTIFDEEVHHVLKDHPYRHIALRVKDWLSAEISNKIQVIGLSASLTYAVGDSSITATLNRIGRELRIEKMISPSTAELEEGGYVSQHGRSVEVESAADVPEGVIPKADRKPHDMYRLFVARVQTKQATEFSQDVWSVIAEMETMAKSLWSEFKSPLSKNKLSSWEEYANKMAAQTPHDVLHKLEIWYTGLCILVPTWKEEQHLVLLWLRMNKAFDFEVNRSRTAFQKLLQQAENPSNFLKLDRLCVHLKEKYRLKGNAFRCTAHHNSDSGPLHQQQPRTQFTESGVCCSSEQLYHSEDQSHTIHGESSKRKVSIGPSKRHCRHGCSRGGRLSETQ
jgi:hypothetical protein